MNRIQAEVLLASVALHQPPEVPAKWNTPLLLPRAPPGRAENPVLFLNAGKSEFPTAPGSSDIDHPLSAANHFAIPFPPTTPS